MDSLYPFDWLRSDRHRSAAACLTDDNDRPSKRLRTAKSHASFLQHPLAQAVREPLTSFASLAASLPSLPQSTHPTSATSAPSLSPEEEERQLQLAILKSADTRQKWEDAAARLDVLEGNDTWKHQDASDDYDWELVRSRLERLDTRLAAGDLNGVAHLIRTEVTRDLGGMGHADLYRRSRIGTKALIERYNDTVIHALHTLVRASGHGPYVSLDARQMQEQIKHTRQSFGRSALLLSGGATFGMNHIGVIKCLLDADLLPRIISGASAGSIVASVIGSKTDAEVPEILTNFCSGPLDVFEEEECITHGSDSFPVRLLKRFAATGAIYDSQNLKRVMQGHLGDMTFQEAYNRTRRILNICVSTANVHDQPRLLNYITAPHVVIWSAVAASCAVPLIFTSAALKVKHPATGEIKSWDELGGKFIDGSVDNDVPTVRLAEMLNVNHFIVSQVNPHVVPFLTKGEDEYRAMPSHTSVHSGSGRSWLQVATSLAKGEALHRLEMLSLVPKLSDLMTKTGSVLGQRYSGDITILPEISYSHFPRLLANPSEKFLNEAVLCGERATWPKLSRIRNHVAVELALDQAVHELMHRVAFSPSQVDVRLGIFTNLSQAQQVRRRGSRASHQSAQSAIAPRQTNAQRSNHRSMKSWHDSNTTHILRTTGLQVPDARPKHEHAPEDDETASASYSDDDGDYARDTENGESESTFDSPPSPVPRQSLSQPATPSVYSRPFEIDTAKSKVASGSRPTVSGALKMTDTRPGSPDVRHVHSSMRAMPKPRTQGTGAQPANKVEPSTALKRFGGKLGLDMPSTKKMMRNRARRSSTGLDELKRAAR